MVLQLSMLFICCFAREAEWDSKVSELMEKKDRPLSCDTSEQEAAVAMLLERSDLESGRLRAQLKIIENQLAHLTKAEMKKARMDISQITVSITNVPFSITILYFTNQKFSHNKIEK